ncbi:uncharacterized protein LOC126742452 [Anthonomus grandis grandis]|uniref:uncharacterized protein LOC126742452 n=1 Tax=Anthonomus grandis grandis TaxID=2921223 RepID=UPI0021665EFE|nr:uncharacterized protein LOC126742452 [Anthonomus grandis grandis]
MGYDRASLLQVNLASQERLTAHFQECLKKQAAQSAEREARQLQLSLEREARMQQTINELTEEIRQLRRQLTEKSEDNDDFVVVSSKRRRRNSAPSPKEHPQIPAATKTPTATSSGARPGFRNQIPPQPAPQAPKREKIPPIVLRDKTRYDQITAHLNQLKINFGHTVNIRDGIKIHPQTIDDYRRTQSFLENHKEQFHSFSLPEEKRLYVVVRGVLEHWSSEKVADNLKEQGFHPITVSRWYNANRKPVPMVLVVLLREEKEIFQVQALGAMRIRVEAQRAKTRSTQCHRCQLFGHGQSHCNAHPKCVKCGKDHLSQECEKPLPTPPSCANCGGVHTTSNQGCPRNPKQIVKARASTATLSTPNFKWGQQNNAKLAAPAPAPLPATTPTNGSSPDQHQMFAAFMSNMQQQFMQLMQSFSPAHQLA